MPPRSPDDMARRATRARAARRTARRVSLATPAALLLCRCTCAPTDIAVSSQIIFRSKRSAYSAALAAIWERSACGMNTARSSPSLMDLGLEYSTTTERVGPPVASGMPPQSVLTTTPGPPASIFSAMAMPKVSMKEGVGLLGRQKAEQAWSSEALSDSGMAPTTWISSSEAHISLIAGRNGPAPQMSSGRPLALTFDAW
mmetsp:Transcript_66811/g.215343  ORF Transcript_66811/g.215343 Transcript_66811/m.215343 type:complete len:200 (-) Transcript_66811:1796-2395(-)